jgi:predicted nucleic acid-binding Zn ribbon protein
MPTYTFKDTQTEEVFDVMMSINDLPLYREANPTHERYFDGVPALISGSSSSMKTDAGFKEVLSRISDAHPESELAREHRRKSIKEVQTERAVKKWRSNTN